MASKRKQDVVDSTSNLPVEKQRRTEVATDCRNEYRGFSLQTGDAVHNRSIAVEDGTISDREFFTKYIAKRRPCVIEMLPKLPCGKCPAVTPEELKQAAGDQRVQIERRFSTSEQFGQNRTASRQITMTLSEFLGRLKQDDGNLLYLSTQETETDDPFQVPCRQLLESGAVASGVPWAGTLILHSCNLWMGSSQQTSSSGLHHDYHDNFYLLIRGRKRFRLYSPDCAPSMYCHGEIEKVHFNGRISYGGRESQTDGVPFEDHSDGSHDDDDEVVLGKGFNYESDSDDDFDQANDDYDDLVLAEKLKRESESDEDLAKETQRPMSFSKIPTVMLDDQSAIQSDFPKFVGCHECIVELKAGNTLYLPAGWFHDVSSGNESEGENHTALNYWYHAPDSLENFQQPYKDKQWRDEMLKRETF